MWLYIDTTDRYCMYIYIYYLDLLFIYVYIYTFFYIYVYIYIYIIPLLRTCTLTKRTNTSQESRSTARMWHHSSGARGFFRFQKTWGVPRFFFCREWMMSNEKSRNLGGVDVFFVSNMFFFDCGFNPNAWGDDPIWRCPLDGLKLPTWNSWGISKKRFYQTIDACFFKQEFWMFKRTSYVDTVL